MPGTSCSLGATPGSAFLFLIKNPGHFYGAGVALMHPRTRSGYTVGTAAVISIGPSSTIRCKLCNEAAAAPSSSPSSTSPIRPRARCAQSTGPAPQPPGARRQCASRQGCSTARSPRRSRPASGPSAQLPHPAAEPWRRSRRPARRWRWPGLPGGIGCFSMTGHCVLS